MLPGRRFAELCFVVLEALASEDVPHDRRADDPTTLREEGINARHAVFDGLYVIRQHGELKAVGQTLVDHAAEAVRGRQS